MSAKDKIFMSYPASWWGAKWREATPIGNGITGAAVYGAVCNETIAISRTSMWTEVCGAKMPDTADQFNTAKKLFKQKQYSVAIPITVDAMKKGGFIRHETYPVPLCDIHLDIPVNKGFTDYSRTLDMSTGEACIAWKDSGFQYVRKQFVSRTNDILCIKIDSEIPIDMSVCITVHAKSDCVKPYDFTSEASSFPSESKTFVKGGLYSYLLSYRNNYAAGAMIKIQCDGNKIVKDSGISISRANHIEVFFKAFDNSDSDAAFDELLNYFSNSFLNYNSFFQEHIPAHREIYNKSSLSLAASEKERRRTNEELLLEAYKGKAPLALIEKLALFGKYLMTCASSDKGGNPCTLTGLWNFEYDAYWSINMANENIAAIYWHTMPANMLCQLDVLLKYFERGVVQMRETAKKIFGCRGIYLPSDTTPDFFTFRSDATHLLYWTAGASWMSQFFYDYYEYTLDEDFLKNRALPFMKEAADFYEDFVSYDKDGHIWFVPSVSPENAPPGYDQPLQNATMDFALLKALLTRLIEGCKKTGLYNNKLLKWQAMLKKIPEYQVNSDGAIKEWMKPELGENYSHRHLSHIYPLFPGDEIDENHPLYGAFVTALKKRETSVSALSAWSFIHLSAALAKIGDTDGITENINNMCRSSLMNNLFTVHNDWRNMGISLGLEHAPFQIDGNTGFTNVIYSCLVNSKIGHITLFPALPSELKKGTLDNFLCKGRITGSVNWNNTRSIASATLVSDIQQTVTVKAGSGFVFSDNDKSEITIVLGKKPVHIKMKIGGKKNEA